MDADTLPTEQPSTPTPASDGYCSLLRVQPTAELMALGARVREMTGGVGEFTDADDLHVTLCYASGGMPSAWQTETVAWRDVIPLVVDGIGVFDTPDGYAVHATVRKSGELAALQAQHCQLALQDGFTLSPHSVDYIPHITLGYVQQPIQPFGVEPFVIMASKIELSNPAHDPVALMSLKTDGADQERVIAFGGAIKSLDNGRIGGYLVRWGDDSTRDLQRQYFTKDTDFCLDWYDKRPVLYHHGLDKTLKTTKIGTIDTIKSDEVGLWAEAQLDMHNKYVHAIQQLIKRGALSWSSGAMPHLVEPQMGEGWLRRWPMMEGSTTPTPAEFRSENRIMSIKSLATLTLPDLPIDPTADEGVTATDTADQTSAVVTNHQPTKGVNVMDEQMLAVVVSAIAQQLGVAVTPEQLPALVEAARVAMQGTEYAATEAAAPEAVQAVTMKAVNDAAFLQRLTGAISGAISAEKAKQEAMKAAQTASITAAIANNMKAAPAITQIPTAAGRQPITDVKDMRFDHLNADAAIFVANTLKSAGKPVSESLMRHAAVKMLREADKGNESYIAAKSVMSQISGIKADEIMATNLSANGSEYVGVAYEHRIWEKVRLSVIYQRFLSKGVFEAQPGQGNNSIYIPTEGADPAWYSLQEINDEDSTERPGVMYKAGTTVTGRRQLTPALLGAKVQYTDVMDEDSLAPLAPFLMDMMQKSAQETIENVMINGDTTTTASTNINLIDGTPSVDAKNRGPLYLAFNGLFKLPLVTTTSLSRDCGGTFDEDDFLNTLKLLPKAERQARERLLYILDSDTITAAMGIATLKTRDVFNNPSLEAGTLAKLFQIEVVESGQIALANSAGKIPAAGGTLGRILLVRPDQWAIAWKRQVTTEVGRDIESGANIIVSSLRFAITSRGTSGGAAVTYNVPV